MCVGVLWIERCTMKKKNKQLKEKKHYYNLSKMSNYDKNNELKRILSGYYDNWKSFGYSGGTCSSK